MTNGAHPVGTIETSLIYTCLIGLLCFTTALAPSAIVAEEAPFNSMAVTPDSVEECQVPRPPEDLAETAYLRNGYRAILRILVAEEGFETKTCKCLLDQFTWEAALNELPRFRTSDNPRLPFKVLDLYAMADALEAERMEACEN
ncbi:hypothetical protein [uncultured Sulfitobacter sp.]|jgi:hypothetical protein|uniref:hypothetical protein n=1 Tax=uncultured Sulfitobacter sp. TaxID=191468 RepID=UPI0030F4FB41